jgi:hypothetical protein
LQLRETLLLEKEKQCLSWDPRPQVTRMEENLVTLSEQPPVGFEVP